MKDIENVIKKKRKPTFFKHGLSRTSLYLKWVSIKSRCYCINSKIYKYYGARGIVMWDKWINDPISFISYCKTLNNYDSEGYSLDRIDNNGDYVPGNLRFTTKHIQSCNTRRKSKNNNAPYRGVNYSKETGKFLSFIIIKGKWIGFGRFHNPIDALHARNDYIIKNGLWEYEVQSE